MRKPLLIVSLAALVATGACTTNPETGQRGISRAALGGIGGALGGYLLGDLVGGRRDRTEKIIGAGLGGLAGAGIGAYMDRQERELRARTAGTTRGPRSDRPPTWRGAFLRGLIAGAIFTVLLLVVFKRPAGAALGLGAFMLVFYVPGGYYFDLVMWRRRERSRMRSSGNS